MQSTVTERIATAVRVEAARRNLNQTDVGKILGLSRFTMSRRMNGRQAFTVGELAHLAEEWRIPMATFVPDDGDVSAA